MEERLSSACSSARLLVLCFFRGFLCLKSLNIGLWYLVCWSMSFIWRMGIATVRDDSSTVMVNQMQSFLIVKILSCLDSLPQELWPKRSTAEAPRQGSHRDGGDRPGHTAWA